MAEVALNPAVLLAVAVNVCVPGVTVVVSHVMLKGAVVTCDPRLVPSSRN